jgi:hypothetical protein
MRRVRPPLYPPLESGIKHHNPNPVTLQILASKFV